MSPAGFFIVCFCLTGCSTRGFYEGIQAGNRIECSRLPPSQYEECVQGTGKPYEEYERERKETLE